MKDKFVVRFTNAPEKENPITPASLMKSFAGYLRKVFWYSKAQITKRHRSYRSMFVISVVMLTFLFTNLILNEARILGAISESYGGTHHIVFLGLNGTQAKNAVEHDGIKDSIIIPVIATMESSVDTSTVGKVAVLTEEIQNFMQIGITHGSLPEDNEIIVPKDIYSRHNFLILGKEQDMYFASGNFIYRPMSLGGIYNSTDKNSPYIFVSEQTGQEIKADCGHEVTFDVYMTVNILTDTNAAKIAGEIIRQNGIKSSAEQEIYSDWSDDIYIYKDYINRGAIGYRDSNSLDINRIMSYGAVIITALIMASFMTNYTERHISEYGILAAYGAKRRHLFGVVMGQVFYVTFLSLIPVLLLSLGGAWLYTTQYNLSRLESNLPVIMSIPLGTIISFALLYVAVLCLICTLTMKKMLSQFPFPMVRGSTAAKLPFVRNSSKRLERAKDKVRHLAFLQSLRLIKRSIIPSAATSVICVICAVFIGYNLLNVVLYGNHAEENSGKTFDGSISAMDNASFEDGYWRGFVTEEDMAALASFDGVEFAGSVRAGIRSTEYGYSLMGGSFEIVGDRSHVTRTPLYADEAFLPYLYEEVLDGDVNRIYTEPNTVILVDGAWEENPSPYRAGDTIKIRWEERKSVEMTVAAIVTGNYVKDLDLAVTTGTVIMSPLTGEAVDGFPANLRRTVYFQFDDSLTKEAYQELCDKISEDVDLIRYKIGFFESERLKATKMTTLENTMTAVFFAMLYIAMCVLDYFHSNESILSQQKEFCTLRQMGIREKDLYKTTRTGAYAGQILSVVFTAIFAVIACCIVSGYCANLSNTYRMMITDPAVLEKMLDMVRDMQNTYFAMIGGCFLLSLPLHGLAFFTAIAGTLLPTKRILSDNIAATLKGSAEI